MTRDVLVSEVPDDGFLESVPFEKAVRRLADYVGVSDHNAARRVLSPFFGHKLDDRARLDAAWRLGAGCRRLREGKPLAGSWEAGPCPPAACRIEDISPVPGKPESWELSLRLYTGRFGGMLLPVRRSKIWVTEKLFRRLGFPADGPAPHPRELVGCRVIGTPALGDVERPGASAIQVPRGLQTFNRKLTKERRSPCPRERPLPCLDCVIGHAGLYPCPRGTHALDFVEVTCPKCKQKRWSPSGREARCPACRASVLPPLSQRVRD